MKMTEIADKLKLIPLTVNEDVDTHDIQSAYQSDLLSCVICAAGDKSIWVTLINNINIVAVAKLLDIPVIIITEGALPDEATIDRARLEGISVYSSPKGNYQIAGELWELGITE